MQLKDFWPINLYNVLFKAVSKILVHRIHPFLNDFIGPCQSSFIPGRGVGDNALVAQEIVHHMHKEQGKLGLLMIKIDFKKAYVWTGIFSNLPCTNLGSLPQL